MAVLSAICLLVVLRCSFVSSSHLTMVDDATQQSSSELILDAYNWQGNENDDEGIDGISLSSWKAADEPASKENLNTHQLEDQYGIIQGITKNAKKRPGTKLCQKSSKKQCQQASKYKKMMCQLQGDWKGSAPSLSSGMHVCDWHDQLRDCTTKSQCTAGQTCCWVPASTATKKCVPEVPTTFYYNWQSANSPDELKSIHPSRAWSLQRVYSSLEVVVLPVGQGDCIVMYCPNGNVVMFDCGSNERYRTDHKFFAGDVKREVMRDIRRVTIFISHGDGDHTSYFPGIFSTDQELQHIDRVIIGGSPSEYKHIQEWIRRIEALGKLYAINSCKECIGDCNDKIQRVRYIVGKKDPWDVTSSGRVTMNSINTCDVSFDLIAANVEKTKNQKSIVLKVTSGGRSILLSGDMEGKAAEAVAATTDLHVPTRLQSNVFQISHHGASASANPWEWVSAVQPQEAFVSHGYQMAYGHPTCKAIQNLIHVGSVSTDSRWGNNVHPLFCGTYIGNRQYAYHPGQVCHRIFSTYPAENTYCTITYTIRYYFPRTTYTCYTVRSAVQQK